MQPKYATLTSLQNAITNIKNIIQTETNNPEIRNQGNSMLLKSYITTQRIQITHTNEKTQYTNMITVEVYFKTKPFYISTKRSSRVTGSSIK